MKKILKNYMSFWVNKTKQIIGKCIDFWIMSLIIFELIICPIIRFITDNPILLLIIWIGSFGLWYPLIKIAKNKF